MQWETGYIGTARWVRDERAKRDAIRAARREAVIAAGFPLGDEGAGFGDVAAPSGLSEPFEGHRGIGGYCGDTTPSPMPVRRLVRDARREGAVRRYRRAVILAAREGAAQSRRERLASAPVAPSYSPLAALLEDVRRGSFVSPFAVVRERLYRRDAQGIVRGSFVVEAPGYMVAVERLTTEYRRERQLLTETMASEPHGSGRGSLAVRAPSSVNGTETRGMPRWTASQRRDVRGADGRELDWTCYRVHPDGRREPLTTTATAKRRKASAEEPKRGIRAADLPPVLAD